VKHKINRVMAHNPSIEELKMTLVTIINHMDQTKDVFVQTNLFQY